MLSEKAEYKFYMYSVIPAICLKKSVRLHYMKLPFFIDQMIEYWPFHVIRSQTCTEKRL